MASSATGSNTAGGLPRSARGIARRASGDAHSAARPNPDPGGPPQQASGVPTLSPTAVPVPTPLPAWDSQSRINILCLGLDDLNPKARYRRSDAIIVISIDPATKSAGMLSIPRDLYVPITGIKVPQRNRINTAYVWGEYYKYPGGGPALAMRVVQETLNVPIHHYIAVDFQGFIKAIDAIGGVDIVVDKPIYDPRMPGWYIPAGKQHLNGTMALRYVRFRYSDNDLHRQRRQQAFLLAVRDQVLRMDIIPKLPALLLSLWGSFKTDLTPAQILSLARLGAEIDPSRIKNRIIDETMVTSYRTPAGAAVLLPKEAAIRQLAREVPPA